MLICSRVVNLIVVYHNNEMNDYVDVFQNIKCLLKDARNRLVHIALCHLYNVQKQAKVIHCVRSQNSNLSWEGDVRRTMKALATFCVFLWVVFIWL